jgi:hypothetical protein
LWLPESPPDDDHHFAGAKSGQGQALPLHSIANRYKGFGIHNTFAIFAALCEKHF